MKKLSYLLRIRKYIYFLGVAALALLCVSCSSTSPSYYSCGNPYGQCAYTTSYYYGYKYYYPYQSTGNYGSQCSNYPYYYCNYYPKY